MSRPLRIQFPGAIYHAMARGNAKQDIVVDDRDRRELLQRLEETVERYAWEMFAFVLMLNHLHLLFRTPQANLSQGMQYFLSGYANNIAQLARRRSEQDPLFQYDCGEIRQILADRAVDAVGVV